MSYEPISSVFSEEVCDQEFEHAKGLIVGGGIPGGGGGLLGFCLDFQPLLTQTKKLETRLFSRLFFLIK
jgi:hypothetical protein